jgi:small subunit ribosomal protein S6
MKKYETIFIMDPDLDDEQTQAAMEKIKGIITQVEGAELVKMEDWGMRRLSYDIRKKSRGRYILVHFSGTPALLSELHRNFRVMDAVIKFQSVRLDERKEVSTKAPPPDEPPEESTPAEV